MEQLKQLKTMRDDAAIRLDAARAAIEVSPDAKLFKSLSSLITELEESLGVAVLNEPEKEDKKAKTFTAPEPKEEKSTSLEDLAQEANSDEMSLEESLEAELLSDSANAANGKTASNL